MKHPNFNMAWKLDPQFKSWMTKDPVSRGNFRCSICHVTLDIENIGKNVLMKRSKSKKHKQNVETSNSASTAMLALWNWVRTMASNPAVTEGIAVSMTLNLDLKLLSPRKQVHVIPCFQAFGW